MSPVALVFVCLTVIQASVLPVAYARSASCAKQSAIKMISE
jgi:hypothetical protein